VSQRKRSTDEANRLERRLAELSQQVREYPTPIARCDEQLAALLEERMRVLEELKKNAS
jgi:chorismate mutase